MPGMMGKNGDQIQRLFNTPADVFFVQYEGEVKECCCCARLRSSTFAVMRRWLHLSEPLKCPLCARSRHRIACDESVILKVFQLEA